MERRDALILLTLLAGGSYFAYRNWDQIEQKLGLDDLSPGRIKAIELAKKQFTFDRYRPNGVVLEERRRSGVVQVIGDPWEAKQQGKGKVFLVVCTYREGSEPHAHHFKVDLATEIVEDQGDHPPSLAAPKR